MIELLAMNRSVPAKIYVDDVFSAYVRTGTGASATITTGNDISGKGGLVITKSRSAATDWKFTDTARGVQKALSSNSTAAESTDTNGITAFSSTGHTVGSDTNYNNSGATYIDYEFCKAAKFFDQSTATVSGGVDATVSFSALGTLGMVIVKNISTGSWYVWHRSLTAGKLLYLEQTAAEAALGHITVSGTTVTLEGGVIANGDYIVYAFAHDTSADGIIQCGSFTTDGSRNATVTLGWEAQAILPTKAINRAIDWYTSSASAEMSNSDSRYLIPNRLDVEYSNGSGVWIPTATGFNVRGLGTAGDTHIFVAIRRPNKPPTSGTQVYNAVARTGTGATATVTGVGFASDLIICKERGSTGAPNFTDRLRGATYELLSSGTAAEATYANDITSLASMDGFVLGSGASGQTNTNLSTYINHCFRRAPGVFDEVCYTGTGVAKTEAHNLTVTPELMIVKSRSYAATNWATYSVSEGPTKFMRLNSTLASTLSSLMWNDTAPTSSVFTVNTHADVNQSTETYVAYLFATKAGISKVGSYTGNGTNQTIDCGFSAGARFVLIKRTDSTGDWYVWDTVRGIVSGNDPHLSLNTTAAEVTTDDSIDTASSGFIVNQDAATNINVNTATYIFLAFA